MAAVKVNTGPVDATTPLEWVAKSDWRRLLWARRDFVGTHVPHDCRELLRFVEEAEKMYAELGFEDKWDLVRRGLEIDPELVDWAIKGLETLQPNEPVPFDDAVALGQHGGKRKGAGRKLGDENPRRNQVDNDKLDSATKGGTSPAYIKARLARDGHTDLLAQVESGERSARSAGIAAGFIKAPDPIKAPLRRCARALPPAAVVESSIRDVVGPVAAALGALSGERRTALAYELIRIAEEALRS